MTVIFFIFISVLFAKDTISIEKVLQSHYDSNITVNKINKEEAKIIQEKAKTKLSSKIIRYYEVKKENSTIGHAILLKKKPQRSLK